MCHMPSKPASSTHFQKAFLTWSNRRVGKISCGQAKVMCTEHRLQHFCVIGSATDFEVSEGKRYGWDLPVLYSTAGKLSKQSVVPCLPGHRRCQLRKLARLFGGCRRRCAVECGGCDLIFNWNSQALDAPYSVRMYLRFYLIH